MKRFLFTALIVLLSVSVASGVIVVRRYAGSLGETTYDNNVEIYTGNIYHDKWTCSDPGPVNYAHVRVANFSGDTICLSLFNASGTELATCNISPGSDTAGWQNCQLDSEVVLADSTAYYGGIQSTGTGNLYNGSGGDDYWYDTNAYDCGQSLDSAEESSIQRRCRPPPRVAGCGARGELIDIS